MKYSLKWLEEHLTQSLPDADTLAKEVTMRAFEVEEIEKTSDDAVFEIKVLPDRAHDALCHRGMAREIAGLLGLKERQKVSGTVSYDDTISQVKVSIEDPKLCPRYVAVPIDGITVSESPEYVKARLESIGQRSINNIVDITNFILFDVGQPLHVFDRDKVKGGITIRKAKPGEKMTTLDNKDITLSGKELVIADDEAVLALAGIKGGKKAEVTKETTRVVLECANFDPTITRKTSVLLNIKTDASKRFENGITSELAGDAVSHALVMIKTYCGGRVHVGTPCDVYPKKETEAVVSAAKDHINALLGFTVSDDDISKVLDQRAYRYTKDASTFTVNIPVERLDLRIAEDLIEEIGRTIGYDKITPVVPVLQKKGSPYKRLHYANIVRKFLIAKGYSEVYTSSFTALGEGVIEVINPVGKDRPYVRSSLSKNIERALNLNLYNAPLLGLEDIKIFEIGNVFGAGEEHASLAIGVIGGSKASWKKLKAEFEEIFSALTKELQVSPVEAPKKLSGERQEILEVNFDALISGLPAPSQYVPLASSRASASRFKTLSQFPFIVRDIALFVPASVDERVPEQMILGEAGDMVVRFARFDKFQKPGDARVSYAYRIVFQSYERTLTDDEVNMIMAMITKKCNAEAGWEVR